MTPASTGVSDINIPPPTGSDIGRTPNNGNQQCHKCNSYYHMANWPRCPHFLDRPSGVGGRGSHTGGRGGGRGLVRGGSSDGTFHAPHANELWKYAKPPDPATAQMTLNGRTLYYCEKCTCRFTGNVGLYNKTHNTPNHIDPADAGASPTTDTPAPAASHTPSPDVDDA